MMFRPETGIPLDLNSQNHPAGRQPDRPALLCLEGTINAKKQGDPVADLLPNNGRKPGTDAPQVPAGNGGQAEGTATPEPELSGVNIDIRLKKAQESLRHCQEAQTLRNLSQSVFAQSESILEEAIRSVEAAVEAYGDGFAADSPANVETALKAQGMAETLRTRLKENQAAYQDVLNQALGTNEIATQDMAAALASLNFEFVNVERELEESAKASSIANAAKESALEELLAVHAMWNVLASQRRDSLGQSDQGAAGESTSKPVRQKPAELTGTPNEQAGNHKGINSAASKQAAPSRRAK